MSDNRQIVFVVLSGILVFSVCGCGRRIIQIMIEKHNRLGVQTPTSSINRRTHIPTVSEHVSYVRKNACTCT